ncbi:outer membrane protein transport protein [Zobellia galactanivorans]|uniref:OmpP1/FadL family transporter n=1 Tax=Zobellia TaxID=112040 RepID=UPI000B52CF90|nr:MULTISPECIES: outer membrane protein transport protein [Zobellia]MBU3025380.1 outer membrane protein transport protein [Zobellia galactanivorans]MDO6811198.1 outer membrane protein transport protein [Zobellia galactanivorans]OWW25116.1 aromatic hydrocarbon degradation protein [Zobellia sp. OII3]
MRKYITFIGLLACVVASAQNIDDVLRYSSENIQGSARFQAMGGAFGSLGGDLSALNINPAGSAVFNNGLFSVSGTNYSNKIDSDLNGSLNSTSSNNFDINQIGGAFVFKSTDADSPWKKLTLALNYDLVQNFDSRSVTQGRSNQGVDNYFLDFAEGIELDPLKLKANETLGDAYLAIGATNGLNFAGQQAFLGFQAGIIEPVSDTEDNTSYFSNADYDDVNHDFRQDITGYNSKFTVNGATQYGDNLYFGASLNFHTLRYERLNRYSETFNERGSGTARYIDFDNLLVTEGSGFSLSLGAIAKVNDFLRVGASYQSPTWYRLTDNFSQGIDSNFPNKESSFQFFNLNYINIFDYQIKTPGKLTGSISAVFGKSGLISFDYGYQDMSNAQLRPTSDAGFANENTYISETLGAVSTIRVGGEYRIQRVSLRAGYRYEQSPYESGDIIGDLTGISGGLGYSFRRSRLDLAISRTEQDRLQYFFDTGINTAALLNNVNTNVTLGYTLNF